MQRERSPRAQISEFWLGIGVSPISHARPILRDIWHPAAVVGVEAREHLEEVDAVAEASLVRERCELTDLLLLVAVAKSGCQIRFSAGENHQDMTVLQEEAKDDTVLALRSRDLVQVP